MFSSHNTARSVSFGGLIATVVLGFSGNVYAQSPLTVQPSTGRVGVGVTNPGYSLDVGTGTVNAGFFRGDGSQLTNLPGGGGGSGTGGYASRGQFSKNNAGAPDSQYDMKADVVILSKPSDQSTDPLQPRHDYQQRRPCGADRQWPRSGVGFQRLVMDPFLLDLERHDAYDRIQRQRASDRPHTP